MWAGKNDKSQAVITVSLTWMVFYFRPENLFSPEFSVVVSRNTYLEQRNVLIADQDGLKRHLQCKHK